MSNENFFYFILIGVIFKVFYKVYNILGYGFLEKVYENVMMIEFDNMFFYVV